MHRHAAGAELIIEPFINEILILVQAFNQSGQSGGSAPYTAKCIADTVEKLMLGKPLCPINDTPEEWEDISYMSTDPIFQHKRDSRVLKYRDGSISMVDSLIWDDGETTFTGRVGKLHSVQKIKLPCIPEPRYVKVTRVPTEDPDDYQFKITDPQEEAELIALYKPTDQP